MIQNLRKLSNDNADTSDMLVFEFKQKDVTYDNQCCRLLLIRDITELVKGEYARSVAKLSDIMIASTSHDMRTPLNTIMSMHHLTLQQDLNE